MKTIIIIFTLALTSFTGTEISPNSYLGIVQGSINKSLLLRLINEARKKGCVCEGKKYQSVPPVEWNDQLEKAAYEHCADMNNKNYFSHTGTDGSGVGERMESFGYQWTNYAENIGMGYKTEQEVIDGWLHSQGHCKNIMNKSYKEIGASKVGQYWTLDFGAR